MKTDAKGSPTLYVARKVPFRTNPNLKLASFAIGMLRPLSKADGTFQALVSVFGNIDLVGDRIQPGFFTNSINRWKAAGDPIPAIWSHQWDDPFAHIGYSDPADVHEVLPGDVAPMVPGGLFIEKSTLDIAKPFAAQVFDLLDARRIREFSFAYDVYDEHLAKDGANDLIEGDLIEYGPTLKGANPETVLVGTKAYRDELDRQIAQLEAVMDRAPKSFAVNGRKAAVSVHHTDTASGSWDGPANEARLSNDAGEATFRKAYAWEKSDGDPNTKAGWGYIHHEVSGEGEVGAANLTTCSTGIGRLNQGVSDMSDGDRRGVYDHLAAHLSDGDQEAPELKDAPSSATKAWVTVAGSHEDLTARLDDAWEDYVEATIGPIGWGYGATVWCTYIEATFDDHFIGYVEMWDDEYGDGDFFTVSFTIGDDGTPVLSAPQPVTIIGMVGPPDPEDVAEEEAAAGAGAVGRIGATSRKRARLASMKGRKAGARNSAADQSMIQDAHDSLEGAHGLLVELGADCAYGAPDDGSADGTASADKGRDKADAEDRDPRIVRTIVEAEILSV